MESGFFLDIVVREGPSIFQLLSGEDKSLLVGRNTFLILDLSLHIVDSVGLLDVKGDGLSSQGLDEDLHTSSKSQDKMESRFLLDVVIGQGSAVLQLLSSEDQSLLVGWDTFLILNLSLDVVNSV